MGSFFSRVRENSKVAHFDIKACPAKNAYSTQLRYLHDAAGKVTKINTQTARRSCSVRESYGLMHVRASLDPGIPNRGRRNSFSPVVASTKDGVCFDKALMLREIDKLLTNDNIKPNVR